ncbi:hypothetical protein IWQ61_002183 [Dispira simplex]|nr:hypothetical protein IWQ61_002183 [Dispira simplex]
MWLDDGKRLLGYWTAASLLGMGHSGLLIGATWTRKWLFKESRLYPIQDIGLDQVQGLVAAFGDFNGDKSTDLFALGDDQRTLDVYLWESTATAFQRLESAHLDFNTWQDSDGNTLVVTSVIPGDFNYDGQMDVLVLGQRDTDDQDLAVHMRVYTGDGKDGFDDTPIELDSAAKAHPIPVDLSGDMTTDLLGFVQTEKNTMAPKLWKNNARAHDQQSPLFTLQDVPFGGSDDSTTLCTFANPHSGAWVDLNGDCRADLFVTCQTESSEDVPTFQIWTSTRDSVGLTFAREGSLPRGAGQVSFSDMDGDGTLDMVFLACENGATEDCTLHIVYNQQVPLCGKKTDGEKCRSLGNLCQPDDTFQFETDGNRVGAGGHIVVDLKTLLPGETPILRDPKFRGPHPVSLQLGDFNFDGFPDVLLSTTTDQGSSAVRLLESSPCNEVVCSHAATVANRRLLTAVHEGVQDLETKKPLVLGTFFDLDDDGTLDVMMITASDQDADRWSTQVLFNNFFNDAFFTKTLVLNGVCLKWCSSGQPDSPIRTPYGVNYPGASIKFTIIDTSGNKRLTQVSQLPQSNYMARLTPYSLFGLGRTNNYIEDLFAGTTYNQSQWYRSWSGVIPNSQLVISPYQVNPGDQVDNWRIELYINVGSSAIGVLVVLLVTIFVLLVTVLVLNWLERREDKKEKDRSLHVINFDAL